MCTCSAAVFALTVTIDRCTVPPHHGWSPETQQGWMIEGSPKDLASSIRNLCLPTARIPFLASVQRHLPWEASVVLKLASLWGSKHLWCALLPCKQGATGCSMRLMEYGGRSNHSLFSTAHFSSQYKKILLHSQLEAPPYAFQRIYILKIQNLLTVTLTTREQTSVLAHFMSI